MNKILILPHFRRCNSRGAKPRPEKGLQSFAPIRPPSCGLWEKACQTSFPPKVYPLGIRRRGADRPGRLAPGGQGPRPNWWGLFWIFFFIFRFFVIIFNKNFNFSQFRTNIFLIFRRFLIILTIFGLFFIKFFLNLLFFVPFLVYF